jgi:hypothetical protein
MDGRQDEPHDVMDSRPVGPHGCGWVFVVAGLVLCGLLCADRQALTASMKKSVA